MKWQNKKCIFLEEINDMGATIKCCQLKDEYGAKCKDCEYYMATHTALEELAKLVNYH